MAPLMEDIFAQEPVKTGIELCAIKEKGGLKTSNSQICLVGVENNRF